MENDKFPKAAFRWGCCYPEQTPPPPPPVLPAIIMNWLTGSARRRAAILPRLRKHGRLDNWAFLTSRSRHNGSERGGVYRNADQPQRQAERQDV